jgi:hypothetical protein
MRGFLEARCSQEPGSRLTTGDLSPFLLSLKLSGANVRWANANHTFLTHKNPQTDIFLHDISSSKLHSTAWVRNPQGISELMNKVDCCLRFAQSNSAGLPCYEILCSGFLNIPLPYGMISKSVLRDIISSSNCRPQWHRSTVDVTHDSWG